MQMLLLLTLSLLQGSVPGDRQAVDDQPYRIGSIFIHRNEVFNTLDSTAGSDMLDIANQVHVLTRESVIRSRLLFSEGEYYSQSRIDETARILRAMGIIGDVTIRCDTTATGVVDVTITTYDKWTLGVNASYRQDGGITSYGCTIKDDNFLGNAQSISAGYNYSSERHNPHGAELILKDPHLLGTWWNLTMQYKANELQDIRTILIERPFYSDEATWSVGAYADAGRSRIRIFQDGIPAKIYDVQRRDISLWAMSSSTGWPRLTAGLGYMHLQTAGDAGPLQSADNLDLVNVCLSVMNRRYVTSTYLNNFGRIEDIPLGFQASVTFGRNVHANAPGAPNTFGRVNWVHAFHFFPAWYFGYHGTMSGFLVDTTPRDATVNFGCLQHFRLSERQVLVLGTNLVLGINRSEGAQLTLGSQNGLRGYPTYALTGGRQFLLNLEHRFFSNIELWIFRFGSALFFDTGTMWSEGERFQRQQFHSSVGFGLRIENTKQGGSGIIRIDFAFNCDEKRLAQVIFSSDHLFRAFQDIDYPSPIALQ